MCTAAVLWLDNGLNFLFALLKIIISYLNYLQVSTRLLLQRLCAEHINNHAERIVHKHANHIVHIVHIELNPSKHIVYIERNA